MFSSKALYSNLLLSTQVYKWVPAYTGKVTGSLCRGLATLSQQHYIEKPGPVVSEKEMTPLDALKSVPTNQPSFPFYVKKKKKKKMDTFVFRFQMVLPQVWPRRGKPVCIHLAGTGDHVS